MLSAVREVEVAVAIDGWAVERCARRSLGSVETVAVAGTWWTWEPLWCVLRSSACQSANARQEQRALKKVGLLQERRSAPKSRNRQNRHARCAALAQISESGRRCESKSVGFASPIEPIEPKSNGATTDTRGGRG